MTHLLDFLIVVALTSPVLAWMAHAWRHLPGPGEHARLDPRRPIERPQGGGFYE